MICRQIAGVTYAVLMDPGGGFALLMSLDRRQGLARAMVVERRKRDLEGNLYGSLEKHENSPGWVSP